MSPSDRLPELGPAALRPGATLRLLPAGLFRAHDGRPHGIPGWQIDASTAARLVAAGSSTGADFLIDYEHQTLNTQDNGLPAPAAGWFKRLEWREGEGLFMSNIQWTEKARVMIAAREYRHLSPVFHYDANTGDIVDIVSVALTNNPALTGLVDLAAAKARCSANADGTSGMSARDRAKFMHAFGFDPNSGESVVALRRLQEDSEKQSALAALSEKDQAIMRHSFPGVFG